MDWENYTTGAIIAIVLLGLALVFGFLCLFAWLGMLLWNASVPSIIGWGAITFWQAMGIKLMITFIFTPLSIKINKKKED